MNSSAPDIQKLSPHLFWDVDVNKISWDDHKIFIVQRILEYGLLSDWINLHHHTGIQEIGKIACTQSDLWTKNRWPLSLHSLKYQ